VHFVTKVGIHKKWPFLYPSGHVSYYVAFVGFQHFLAILGKIGGQETFFTGTVLYSRSL
jgi:hypothetical protein